MWGVQDSAPSPGHSLVVSANTKLYVLTREHAPVILEELHALLLKSRDSDLILPQSIEGKAIAYTLKRWQELTVFLKHHEVELSTNLAEDSMRPIALGRRNCLHLAAKTLDQRIAAIFSIVESSRRLNLPIRKNLADVPPGLANRSIHTRAR